MNKNELVVFINHQDFEIDYIESREKINHELSLFYQDLYEKYQEDKFLFLLDLGLREVGTSVTESLYFLYKISSSFIKAIALTPEIETIREKVKIDLDYDKLNDIFTNIPYMTGSEYLNKAWLTELWDELHVAFTIEMNSHQGTVESYINKYNKHIHLIGRVFFHLVENKKGDYPFAFLATFSKRNSNGKSSHLPLKNALIEYEDNQAELLNILSTVNKAALKSQLIDSLLDSGEIFHPIGLTVDEAFTFLNEVPLYEESGILCRIPNFWKNKNKRLKMSITVGDEVNTKMNQDTILDFNIQLSLDGEKISVDEIKQIISSTDGLANIKGKWIAVDQEKLKKTLVAYDNAKKSIGSNELSIIEAIRLQLSSDKLVGNDTEDVEVEINQGKWLKETLSKLSKQKSINELNYTKDFYAKLRPYQEEGFHWLSHMKQLGLGACLADDMGLGKTIQVLALLNSYQSIKKDKNLLIVPASLIGNWIDELIKFAPNLNYYVVHPSENKDYNLAVNTKEYDLFITTYGLSSKVVWIKEQLWDTLILDEAQAIKNPQTKQTKSVKQINAKFRVALTGTPIENRLSDLWSLFDFLNKGLLGSQNEFKSFKAKIKESNHGYLKLKNVVSPFILRRLKTDKTIIQDLPDKIEMKVHTTLSKKQIALYQSLVEDIKKRLITEEGIKRSGIILSSLIKFKQICNHPAQYLGQNDYNQNESGKYKRLQEICMTIKEKRERVLIFTQFREMVEPLQEFLQTIFMHEGLILHGGTPVKKRKEIVKTFQDEKYVPFMILSIKAGGVGLNLTKANHVIHFDRWWNPAIENQATDRAFRIGQNKNVIVHKFITKGTLEEKIDKLIEEKTKLTREIIPTSQEKWITDMNNDEIIKLFSFNN